MRVLGREKVSEQKADKNKPFLTEDEISKYRALTTISEKVELLYNAFEARKESESSKWKGELSRLSKFLAHYLDLEKQLSEQENSVSNAKPMEKYEIMAGLKRKVDETEKEHKKTQHKSREPMNEETKGYIFIVSFILFFAIVPGMILSLPSAWLWAIPNAINAATFGVFYGALEVLGLIAIGIGVLGIALSPLIALGGIADATKNGKKYGGTSRDTGPDNPTDSPGKIANDLNYNNQMPR